MQLSDVEAVDVRKSTNPGQFSYITTAVLERSFNSSVIETVLGLMAYSAVPFAGN